ncbi:MAG: SH3 domain-containing protein [Anaerolineaceae bacterium]|nr:SH3 domain-containing protein [Anaerolineaceae bacterium]MBN2678218.1 SH3 domain-containing protein [Anaerolineaceae bacterium]
MPKPKNSRVQHQKSTRQPAKVTINLSSPLTLIILGLVAVLVVLMVIFAFKRDQQPAQPVVSQDIEATLEVIVNLTANAQASLSQEVTSTATATDLPPTPTFTLVPPTTFIMPTRTPMTGAYSACPNAYPSVLHAGDVAMVSLDPPKENILRDKPGTDSLITGTLEPGEQVNIVSGPACMGPYVWWSVVSRSSGRAGWTAEGDWNDYWLVKQD